MSEKSGNWIGAILVLLGFIAARVVPPAPADSGLVFTVGWYLGGFFQWVVNLFS